MANFENGDTHPFDIIYDYQTRCLKSANNHPLEEKASADFSGLGYQLGNHKIITPLDEVSEYLNLPSTTNITRIPRVKSWVSGITNVRGRLVPILDLNGFFDFENSITSKRRRLLVVENPELICGFSVDSVFGLETFSANTFHPGAPTDHDKLRPFISGYFEKNNQIWFVLNLKKVLEHDHFFDVAI